MGSLWTNTTYQFITDGLGFGSAIVFESAAVAGSYVA